MATIRQTEQGVERREQIVAFIDQCITGNGYSPTVREIGRGVGLTSTSTVQHHLGWLREEGRITWVDGFPRTFRLAERTFVALRGP